MNDNNKISLTSEERETVISWCDADSDKRIWIYTSQQPMIRKLHKNQYFELVQEHISNIYRVNPIAIEGYLPLSFLTIRSKKRTLSKEHRLSLSIRMKNLHKAVKPNVKTRFSEKQQVVGTLPLKTKTNFEKNKQISKKRR